ncbi:sulfite exporter TauE/SafE family protein [Bradymonas sediminis]|uniref:Urease accessory protein UreH-like transmembrane domain-containing protein n=1 Tax=Bradymonas sediminis TaxID=1548548 RepID=A0A2Z4FNW7_9DELT|nr:sulfite exporter TauE/SafE family protein [Bradymonas sediminis]AWV90679.1 hypothetical protein DN745_15695 [Bradymonas sediminis]TDP62682.1 hypothetical protein DFR33_11288 [Bradymonas sediminis]
MDAENVMALYAQLVGVGFLWVTVHCSGMCGPIIAGLVVHTHPQDQQASPWAHRWSVVKHVLAYQSGRGLMYALLGLLAGLLGAQVEATVQPIAATASLLVALLLLLLGLAQLPVVMRRRARLRVERRAKKAASAGPDAARPKPPLSARFVAGITRRLPSAAQFKGPLRMFVTGFMLGLLPCMLMFWVLGLAASSASPLHGALLMVTLVGLTTPVLVAAGLSTTLVSPKLRRLGQHIVPFGMIFSGIWLGLIAMAANGWIEHIHLPFTLFGKKLVMMLW